MGRRKGGRGDNALDVLPSPPAALDASWVTWPAERPIHRIHQDRFEGVEFNPGLKGNARFSPIQDADEKPISTLYGGSTFDCAAMETVFHDVPHTAGTKIYDKGKLMNQLHSQLVPTQPLQLVDLRSVALRKLGVTRKQLIDTEKDQYPKTRSWAVALHDQCPDAQGLLWTSRQDDSAQAIMLFGDRVKPGVLEQCDDSLSLVAHEPTYDAVLDLAERIGVDVIPATSSSPFAQPIPTVHRPAKVRRGRE
ncbi:RES family NAD+ phosphorylase [Pseudomonas citronellolis]|uniref:RES family NAD+ phosphorylase n=1 Tax=Pseudomonas citronellolis TaxID=53408 RepID=UPI0021C117D0|nr:RES family NAD+ phosphorylase [Pseudomonas citronellolis]UXJ50095.1 RES family NAD+ phosphorylase [Pseudomonas citronellolis]